MKLGILGDVHLSYFNKNYIIETLKNIYSKDIDLFIILGDIFDNINIETHTYLKLLDILNNLITKPTILLTGNHDVYSNNINTIRYFNNSNTINIYDKYEIIDLNYYGYKLVILPYLIKDKRDEIIDNLKKDLKFNKYILFTHYDYNDLKNYELLDLKDKFIYIFTGHIHNNIYPDDNFIYFLESIININFNTSNRLFPHWIKLDLLPDSTNITKINNIHTPLFLSTIISINDFLKYDFSNKNKILSFLLIQFKNTIKDFDKYISLYPLKDINLKIYFQCSEKEKIDKLKVVYDIIFYLNSYFNKVVFDFILSSELMDNSISSNMVANLQGLTKINIYNKLEEFVNNYNMDVKEIIRKFKEDLL